MGMRASRDWVMGMAAVLALLAGCGSSEPLAEVWMPPGTVVPTPPPAGPLPRDLRCAPQGVAIAQDDHARTGCEADEVSA